MASVASAARSEVEEWVDERDGQARRRWGRRRREVVEREVGRYGECRRGWKRLWCGLGVARVAVVGRCERCEEVVRESVQ